MIQTHQMVMEQLASYASPKAKVTRMVADGDLLRIRRGLYITDSAIPRRALAPIIYGPSYISFQSALAYYGLIPERVETVDSASFGKNRNKMYNTPLGTYRYLYLPSAVYPYGLDLVEEDGYQYLIATREKAICDAVYKSGKLESDSDAAALLIDDWRIAEEDLRTLNHGFISSLAPRYGRKSVAVCAAWLSREYGS